MLFSVIDIGSNTFHHVLAEHSGTGNINIMERNRKVIRLVDFSREQPVITPDKIAEAVNTISGFLKKTPATDAVTIAAGTAALREARNSAEFLDIVFRETGLQIKIISAKDEAHLTWVAASTYLKLNRGLIPALPQPLNNSGSESTDKPRICVIDIGGGSTEYIFGYAAKVYVSGSLRLGTVRTSMQFLPEFSLSASATEAMQRHINTELAPMIEAAKLYLPDLIIGTSGIFRNLCLLKNEFIHRDNSFSLSLKDTDELTSLITARPQPVERRQRFGIDAMINTDILPAGVMILRSVMRLTGIKQAVYSHYGFREGLILRQIL